METTDRLYVQWVWLNAIRRRALPFLQASPTPPQGAVTVDIRKNTVPTTDQLLMASPPPSVCILERVLTFPEPLFVQVHDSCGCWEGHPKTL